jgi:hypothetical protein
MKQNMQTRTTNKPIGYMLQKISRIIVAVFATGVIACCNSQAQSQLDDTSFQKGITFVSWNKGEYSTSAADQSLTNLVATGSNSVAIIVTVYQDTITSTEITSTDKTPSDEDLVHIISKAHALGLRVLLKPHVDIQASGNWRGEIGFTREEDWQAWFNSYQKMITHYADIAQQTSVEIFSVGTELVKTSGRAEDWKSIVAETKKHFSGKLTYASNFDEAESISWWSSLDYIGIDAYYSLPTSSETPSVKDLKDAWIDNGYIATLKQLTNKFNKPIFITEIGYRSVKGANNAPWEWSNSAEIDLNLQANLYQAALETFMSKDWVGGIYIWNWSADPMKGGIGDNDYTPQNKPAEKVLKDLYSNPK